MPAYESFQKALQAAELLYRYAFHPESQQLEIQDSATLNAGMITTCLRLAESAIFRCQALAVAEAGKARTFLDQMAQADFPPPAGVPTARINAEKQILERLREAEMVLQSTNLSEEFKQHYAYQRKVSRDELESLWATMEKEFPQAKDYVALRRGVPPVWEDLAALAVRMGTDTALVEFFTLENETAAFVWRAGWQSPQVFSLPLGRQRLYYRFLLPY